MNSIKNILFCMENNTPLLIKLLVNTRKLFKPFDLIQSRKQFHRIVQDYHQKNNNTIPDFERWENSFWQYLRKFPRNIELFNSFVNVDIKQLKNADAEIISPVIGICVVKNDLVRLRMVIHHYRSIGINHFAVIDNGSTDGTLEWLLAQNDIDIYQVKEPFKSIKKYGWINRVLANYGFDKWFLYFDSDEKIVMPDLNLQSVDKLIAELESRRLDRIAGLMVDMYSASHIYNNSLASDLPIDEVFCYFDQNSYLKEKAKRGLSIKGGPRKRVFTPDSEDSPQLIKHPLFKLTPATVFESAHYLYPFRFDVPVYLGILHYKFLPGDLSRHQQIAKDGSFQGGSREYKRYLEKYDQLESMSFWYEDSIKYENPASLKAITVLENIKKDI